MFRPNDKNPRVPLAVSRWNQAEMPAMAQATSMIACAIATIIDGNACIVPDTRGQDRETASNDIEWKASHFAATTLDVWTVLHSGHRLGEAQRS